MPQSYDYLVIGSGPAGHTSAIKAAQLGLKVALVEKDPDIGGVCLNEGCIPAKSLYHSAEVFNTVKKSPASCGVEVSFSDVCVSKFVEKSRRSAEELRKGLIFVLKKNNVDLIEGRAEFLDKETVEVLQKNGERLTLKAKKFLIATGSRPRGLTGVPFTADRVISSSKAICIDECPKRMLIIGGGAIGTEFASFFNILGTEVCLIEAAPAILPCEDREISRRLESIFKRKGIMVRTSIVVKRISVESNVVKALIADKEGEHAGEYDLVLVAIGRVPSVLSLELARAGVKTDKDFFIPVNRSMRTNIENIYAAGDVVRSPMLAHVASAEGEVAAIAAAGKVPEPIDYTAVPNAVYTEVQVASVGMTEEEAVKNGVNYAAGKHFFKANGMAVVTGETEGFIKIIAEKDTYRILGAHILGHKATELVHEFVLAKQKGLSAKDIVHMVHAHPTLSEGALEAARAVLGAAIHG